MALLILFIECVSQVYNVCHYQQKNAFNGPSAQRLFAFKVQFSDVTFFEGKYFKSSNFDNRCC